MKHTQEAWAVVVNDKQFALDGHGVRWITGKRKDAVAFAKELRQHVSAKCKAIKVTVTIESVDDRKELR